jgi:hypothetical protein
MAGNSRKVCTPHVTLWESFCFLTNVKSHNPDKIVQYWHKIVESQNGLFMPKYDNIWTFAGFWLDFRWTFAGFLLDFGWTFAGLLLDFGWIFSGLFIRLKVLY